MRRNKELFFYLSSTGKRVSMKEFREKPVEFDLFVEIISDLKNINISNTEWLKSFYQKYKNNIFTTVTSKNPKEYSKYYWNTECLQLNANAVTNEYWLQRGWSKDELIEKRNKFQASMDL